MKLQPTYVYKATGERLINAYKITLSKVETEKAGFKAGDELKVKFEKEKITIKKDEE